MPKRSLSIAEARSNFPSMVKEAESGTPVEITRRGRPVAVVVSASAYQRLCSERPSFGSALGDFLSRVDTRKAGLTEDDLSGLRDGSSGRKAPW